MAVGSSYSRTGRPLVKQTNEILAEQSLRAAQIRGVEEWIVCPGARNGPWIDALRSGTYGVVYWHFEERSAAFFALGRARSTGKPVAILTTSGTAVGELLPATMEAMHSGTPLVLMSADRPRRYRGTGAPQSCLQPGIFSHFVGFSADWHSGSNLEDLELREIPRQLFGPIHLNICFEDPRRPIDEAVTRPAPDPDAYRMPLLILGELSIEEARVVRQKVLDWGYPVVTEALSQLRGDRSLDSLRVSPHRGIWEEARLAGYEISGVIRIGGIPTHRIWRDLEGGQGIPRTVFSLSRLPFSGTVGGGLKVVDLRSPETWGFEVQPASPSSRAAGAAWITAQGARQISLDRAIRDEPWSEPGIFRWLSEQIDPGSEVYLGNSSPIREWDLAASKQSRPSWIHASRGLNGIDGQVSTFLGTLRSGVTGWAILGDLTTLYDPSGPWALRGISTCFDWHLVVVNNRGGRIFERMFQAPEYLSEHSFGFESWARQWGLSYQRLEKPGSLSAKIIEIIPDPVSTRRFWSAGGWD